MKISLNLLPPSRRKEFARKWRMRKIVFHGSAFAAVGIYSVAIMGVIFFMLYEQEQSVDEISQAQLQESAQQEVQRYEESFRDLNQRVRTLRTIGGAHIRWHDVLQHIAFLVSKENITVTSISLDGFKLKMSGEAETRDALLRLKQVMEEDRCFQNVMVPNESFEVPVDVQFAIEALVVQECATQPLVSRDDQESQQNVEVGEEIQESESEENRDQPKE